MVVEEDERYGDTYVSDSTVYASIFPMYLRILIPLVFPRLSKLTDTPWKCLCVDFSTVILPLQVTVLFFNKSANSIILLLCSFVVLLLIFFRCQQWINGSSSALEDKVTQRSFFNTSLKDLQTSCHDEEGRKFLGHNNFITMFRGYVNIFTVFCILAVDFKKIFPDYMRKSRIYGGHLMDTGVGCFILANAVVSPEAKNQRRRVTWLLDSLKSSSILIVLGILRFFLLKKVGLSTSVIEYGVHWNFFFTIGVVKFVSTVICVFAPRVVRSLLAIVIIVSYQYSLLHKGLLMFVIGGSQHDGTRDNFLDANREGIISCLGYLSIYLIGTDLGSVLVKKRQTVKDLVILMGGLILLSLTLTITLHYAGKIHPVSRRLANLAFVVWMLSFNVANLTFGIVLDVLVCYVRFHKKRRDLLSNSETDGTSVVPLMDAINFNGLLYFILGNNLTGIVNLVIKPKRTRSSNAFIILTIYMFVLSAIMTFFYQKRWSFKTVLYQCFHCCRKEWKIAGKWRELKGNLAERHEI